MHLFFKSSTLHVSRPAMETLFRIIFLCQSILRILLRPLFYIISKSDVFLPETKYQNNFNPLSSETATKIAERIRTGQVKSEDVVRAVGFRARRMNNFINAIAGEHYEKSDADTYAVDQLVESNEISLQELAKEKPLLGVPISIAQACRVKGMPFNIGCLSRKDIKADQDGKAVDLLKKAGAIPYIVTNQSELCVGFETNNYINGRTLNPYCRQRSVGGASGGEAAIISSGGSYIGLVTDFAGSIQVCAMFTGIFGHKPTPDLVPSEGHYGETFLAEDNLFGTGFMTRYAEDLPLMMSILASDKKHLLKLDKPINTKDIKLFYYYEASKTLGFPQVSGDIKKIMKKATMYLTSTHGCQTQRINFKGLDNMPEIVSSMLFSKKCLHLIGKDIDIDYPKGKYSLTIELIKSLFGLSKHSTGSLVFSLLKITNCNLTENKIEEYIKQGKELREDIKQCLGDDGVLIFPSFTTPAHYHRESILRSSSFTYSAIISLLGLPSTHIPMGLNKNQLPIGFQVVAAPNQDRLCFAVAKELETGFGGWVTPK